ncbi:MAG: hypothetical protein GQ564_05405 [Bacteroidales bacterium]|nr:hypothetical protein [Bacteroidales bacterium]
MSADYLNLSLQNFLDAITDNKNVFEIKCGETIIIGTLTEIESFINEIEDIETKNKLISLSKGKKEYVVDYELSEIEIYNYLEKITGNFDPLKSKITLNDVEVYYSMIFLERIYEESTHIYENEEWEFPSKEIYDPIDDKFINVADHKAMIKRTHIADGFAIRSVIHLLKKHSPEEKETNAKKYKISNSVVLNNEKSEKLIILLNDKVHEINHFYKKNSNSTTEELFKFHDQFRIAFNDLYEQSLKENSYWQYCPFKVYESHFEKRKESFLKNYIDSSELDFLKSEIKDLSNSYNEDKGFYYHPVRDKTSNLNERLELEYYFGEDLILNEIIDDTCLKKIEYSQKRKLEFLNSQINGYQLEEKEKLSNDIKNKHVSLITQNDNLNEIFNSLEYTSYKSFLPDKEFYNEKEIKKLNLEDLRYSDSIYYYYDDFFKFCEITDSETGNFAYIPENADSGIRIEERKSSSVKFLHKEYIKGFRSEYFSFNPDISTDELKIWHIGKRINAQYKLPTISFKNGKTPFYSEDKILEYGIYIAQIYRAWEIIIESLPVYERLLFPENKSNKKTFPFSITYRNVPDNYKNLYLLNDNIDFVLTYLKDKKDSNFTKGYWNPHITYNSFKKFATLVTNFSDDFANNIENKKLSFKNLPIRVSELNSKLNQCIELIENYKNEFFSVEMHHPEYYDKEYNWYKLIYTELKSIKVSLEWYYEALPKLKKEEQLKENSKKVDCKKFWEYILLESDENKKKLASYIVDLNKNEKGLKIAYSIIALNKLFKLGQYTKTHLINSIKEAGCDKITNTENILQYLRNDKFYTNEKENIHKNINLIKNYIQQENLY